MINSMLKYRFLMKQLVARDFKTKYKRSVLGVLWSFLNPLLTMSIQFVIFSTLFKSDIDNFVVYLLTGIICFNFFSEAANMCLMSIIGNATLINKVYVPKYIYPLSRSLSSGINLLLSLIPLLLMLLITKTPITPAILLLPFALIMLFLFSYGVGLILATMMVFFRDTQFLWNIFSMLLMYLTPIFYPETIIPTQFLWLYRLNPMYQIITFVRTILIEGISPGPAAYLGCILVAVIPLLIGLLIFKKNEDKFVLNI
ncbi:MAG: ABC transporter permease [Clostridia bacterium]|nr:ABC transporter permease [Clostridia bacterium]